MNSTCSYHITPSKGYFSIYKPVDNGVIYMRNNQACKIAGIGTVTVKMTNETERTFHRVRYVPSLKRNLISLGQSIKDGYVSKGQGVELKIT